MVQLKIQFTQNPNQLEIWPLDKWSRDNLTRIMAENKMAYTFEPTTMGTVCLRFKTQKDFDSALQLAKFTIIEDKYGRN